MATPVGESVSLTDSAAMRSPPPDAPWDRPPARDLDPTPRRCEYAPEDADPWMLCLAGSPDVRHRCRETCAGQTEVDHSRGTRARRDRDHLCAGDPADRVVRRRPHLAEGHVGGGPGF